LTGTWDSPLDLQNKGGGINYPREYLCFSALLIGCNLVSERYTKGKLDFFVDKYLEVSNSTGEASNCENIWLLSTKETKLRNNFVSPTSSTSSFTKLVPAVTIMAEKEKSSNTSSSSFSIDQANIYDQLGKETIVQLSTTFYNKVYKDQDAWFRGLFKSPIEEAIQDQCEFFIQRLGGPPLYSQRKGHPALRARHARFKITKEAADRWLKYMREALAEVVKDDVTRTRLDEFFTHVAYFLQNINEDGTRLY